MEDVGGMGRKREGIGGMVVVGGICIYRRWEVSEAGRCGP